MSAPQKSRAGEMRSDLPANGELAAFREQWRADINERRRGRRSVNADEHGPPAGESSVRLQRPERTQQHQKQVCNDSAAVLDHDEPAEPGTSHQDDSHPEKALDVWEAGLQHEQQGKLSDALMCYRRALKMDANVENTYRQMYFPRGKAPLVSAPAAVEANKPQSMGKMTLEDTNYARVIQTTHDYDPDEHDEKMSILTHIMTQAHVDEKGPSHTMDEMSEKEDEQDNDETAQEREEKSWLYDMPDEVLVQIMTYACLEDVTAVSRLSQTCRKLYVLLQTRPAIWRQLCYQSLLDDKAWPYNGLGDAVAEMSAEVASERYGKSWKRMLIEKPRIRYNGIYIATCTYARPGVNDAAWNQPIHMVTYYRYLRFYPDGSCLFMLTPTEPRAVVHTIQWSNPANNKLLVSGTWTFAATSGQLSVTLQSHARYTFILELLVKSTQRGKHDKLGRVAFWSVDLQSLNKSEFPPRASEKSFFFSKVRSYQKEAAKDGGGESEGTKAL